MEEYKYWGWKNEELIQLAKDGDEDAYTQLFYNLKPITIHMAVLYGGRVPIYDMDDYLQEGQILIWELVSKHSFLENFATYYSAAVKNRFIDMYYHYCKNNLIVLCEKECDGYNTAILVESDYLRRKREKEHEKAKLYRKKYANEIRIREKEYRLLHREEVNAKKREYWHAHKDELNARRRQYRNENKDKVYAQNRAYREKHKNEINSRRRVRRNLDSDLCAEA